MPLTNQEANDLIELKNKYRKTPYYLDILRIADLWVKMHRPPFQIVEEPAEVDGPKANSKFIPADLGYLGYL